MSDKRPQGMRHYELVVLVNPGQSDKVQEMFQRWQTTIQGQGGQVHRFEDWGRRPLAYSIDKAFKAHYLLFNIECTPETLEALESGFRFNDAILRHLTVHKNHAETAASAMTLEGNKNHDANGRRGGRIDKQRIANISYMDVEALWTFLMETGRLIPARLTGTSAKLQRRVSHAVKVARYLALLPYCDRHQ